MKKPVALFAGALIVSGGLTGVELASSRTEAKGITTCNKKTPTSTRGYNDNCSKGAYAIKFNNKWTRGGDWVSQYKWSYNWDGLSYATTAVMKG